MEEAPVFTETRRSSANQNGKFQWICDDFEGICK
jgi:hypothetical protein